MSGMKVIDLVAVCQYWQVIRLTWVSDNNPEGMVLFEGTKQELINNMDEEKFSDLVSLSVVIIEIKENTDNDIVLDIKAEDKYFWMNGEEYDKAHNL